MDRRFIEKSNRKQYFKGNMDHVVFIFLGIQAKRDRTNVWINFNKVIFLLKLILNQNLIQKRSSLSSLHTQSQVIVRCQGGFFPVLWWHISGRNSKNSEIFQEINQVIFHFDQCETHAWKKCF